MPQHEARSDLYLYLYLTDCLVSDKPRAVCKCSKSCLCDAFPSPSPFPIDSIHSAHVPIPSFIFNVNLYNSPLLSSTNRCCCCCREMCEISSRAEYNICSSDRRRIEADKGLRHGREREGERASRGNKSEKQTE